MGHLRKASLATAASLLAMLMLAGCGGDEADDNDSSDKSEDETTSATTEATEATTSATTSPSPTEPTEPTEPMDTSGDITQEQVDAALLTAEEVSPELTEVPWVDESSAPPCDPNATPTDEQVPPQVEGGVSFEAAGGAFMEEVLSIYETEALAAEAFQLGSAGLDCTTGTFEDGSTFTIAPPTDVSADVNTSGLGATTMWEVSGEGFEGALIVTLSSRVLLVTTFIAPEGSDTSGLPAPVDVAKAAFDKALAN